MQEWLQGAAMYLADRMIATIPRPMPARESLQRCKLISHRGEHDNKSVFENTLHAFTRARESGVWGIECDIRWTADLVPIICHDPDGKRLFGSRKTFSDCTLSEIREHMPLIPTLEELLTEFGGHTHLMLEIKEERYPRPEQQKQILKDLLSGLSPGRDYHFLSLEPSLLERVDFVAKDFWLPVAQTAVSRFSQASIESGYGGLTGHYLLLSNEIKHRHEAVGQAIGTGFVNSRNCLFRELNRGIEWIFSNEAVKMQGVLDELRSID